MALFTDGLCSSLEDLSMHDASVLEVASTEGIDLASKLLLSQEAVALELERLAGGDTLNRVVVTSALRLLHVTWALEQVYWDAYNRQLNDRYRGRWEEYSRMRKGSLRNLLDTGIGMVVDPIPKAQPPLLGSISGNGRPAIHYVQVAWVNLAGEEGMPSGLKSIDIGAGFQLTVRATECPSNASGWNVFVGYTPDEMTQQNGASLATDACWVQPALMNSGARPGLGQRAAFTRAVPRILRRG
jgi:hypothetical protein